MPRTTASRAEIERQIGDLAVAFGWRYHQARCLGLTRAGYADGFPGHVLLRDGRLVFITIAGSAGALIPPEAAWAKELGAVVTVEMHVVQRDDLRALTRVLRPQAKERRPRRALEGKTAGDSRRLAAGPSAGPRAPPGGAAAAGRIEGRPPR